MSEYSRDFIVGKNEAGVLKLENHPENVYDEDIFLGTISDDEYDFINREIAETACREHDIDFCDFEYDEIPNDLVDYFFGLIGDNKDKVPVFYQALEYAKESGGIIQICF